MTEARISQGAPYERLREQFRNLPELNEAKDYREKVLSDNTVAVILLKRNYPGTPVREFVFSYQGLEFAMDAEGLSWIDLPAHEFRIGDSLITQRPSFHVKFDEAKEDKVSMAAVFMDWVDQLIKEDKHVPSPISVTL